MYRISKQFAFSASHVLGGLPDGHPCARMHGHNYVIDAELETANLDSTGFVYDYGDLAQFSAWLNTTFDHRHLNDAMPGNPTAENLARACTETLTGMLPARVRVYRVGASETPKTWAWHYPQWALPPVRAGGDARPATTETLVVSEVFGPT